VRKFKMRAGLLDASEGTDDYEKTKAAFNMVMRRIDALIDKGSKATARAELLRAEKMIPPMPEDWQRRNAYRDLVNRQMKLNDRNAAQRLARRMIREDEDALDEQILWDLGLQRQALLRIEDDLLVAGRGSGEVRWR